MVLLRFPALYALALSVLFFGVESAEIAISAPEAGVQIATPATSPAMPPEAVITVLTGTSGTRNLLGQPSAGRGATSPSPTAPVPPTTGAPSTGTVWVKPGDPIPPRQWVERRGPVPSPTCNPSADSNVTWNAELCAGYPPGKHMRMFYHPPTKSMVIAGGDHSVSMPHPTYYDATGSEIISVNVSTNSWKIIQPFCVSGALQPNRPDSVGWAYDSKRDRALMVPGYYFLVGSGCGAVEGHGGYAYDFATKKWIGPDDPSVMSAPAGGWGGDMGSSFAVYDPVTDELVRVRNGPLLERFNLTSKKWRYQTLKRGDVGSNWNPASNRMQSAIDVQSRAVYWLDAALATDGKTLVSGGSPALIKVNLGDGSVTSIRLPAEHRVALAGNDMYLVFDSINRVVMIPNNLDMGAGPIVGLGIYHVDSGQWEWESVPPTVMGSAWGFDENLGVLVGIGKRSQPYAYFLWKYGPKSK
jgi:hypothetical protein